MTYQELEDQFYLSNSSLKRLLAKLRGALKVYGLNIKSNPFMIIGDERLIRNFYTQYFGESYSHTERIPYPCALKVQIAMVTGANNAQLIPDHLSIVWEVLWAFAQVSAYF